MMLSSKNAKKDLSPKTNVFSSALSCYLFPFIIFGGYLLYSILANLIPSADGYYLIQYLYTYDHGYISRGLVGEIISWFVPVVTDEITKTVITIFSALLMLGMTLCIGKALSKVRLDKERLTLVLFVAVMIFMIPMPFKFYYEDIKLDKLVWALTLFAVYLSDNKIGKWLVPIICMIATVVNPIFVFTSMILIAIILLQEFHSSGMSAKNGILCGVTYVTIIALALLAPISERWVGFENAMEMVDYYFARYAGTFNESLRPSFNYWLMDFFEPVETLLAHPFEVFFKDYGMGMKTLINFVLVGLPAYAILGIFWKKVIKAEENKFQKFIYFLCAVSPIVIIPPLILSWEFSKLFCNNIFVQAGLVIYFISRGNSAVVNVCNDIKDFAKKHVAASMAVISYFVCYFAVMFN